MVTSFAHVDRSILISHSQLVSTKSKIRGEGQKHKHLKKCIHCKAQRVKMVLNLDVAVNWVEELSSKALVCHFIGKMVKDETLKH